MSLWLFGPLQRSSCCMLGALPASFSAPPPVSTITSSYLTAKKSLRSLEILRHANSSTIDRPHAQEGWEEEDEEESNLINLKGHSRYLCFGGIPQLVHLLHYVSIDRLGHQLLTVINKD